MTCWEVLQLPPDSSGAAIRRAYLRLASTRHPDKGGTVEGFLLLKNAYSVAMAKAATQVWVEAPDEDEPVRGGGPSQSGDYDPYFDGPLRGGAEYCGPTWKDTRLSGNGYASSGAYGCLMVIFYTTATAAVGGALWFTLVHFVKAITE